MKLYWIRHNDPLKQRSSPMGYGVTARDEQDAVYLLVEATPDLGETDVAGGWVVKTINAISEIDQEHVVPNMGNHMKRGIWFPQGVGDLS